MHGERINCGAVGHSRTNSTARGGIQMGRRGGPGEVGRTRAQCPGTNEIPCMGIDKLATGVLMHA